MAPFKNYTEPSYRPPPYQETSVTETYHSWVRFGFGNNLEGAINNKSDRDDYLMGILLGSLFIFAIFIIWSIVICILSHSGKGWVTGRLYRPMEPDCVYDLAYEKDDEYGGGGKKSSSRRSMRSQGSRKSLTSNSRTSSSHGPSMREVYDVDDESVSIDTRGRSGRYGYDDDDGSLSIHTTDDDGYDADEELTMAIIAREQRLDPKLQKAATRYHDDYSRATNGSISLITGRNDDGDPRFRVVIPRSIRARLLRTYHEALMHPTEEENFDTVVVEHFTWPGMRRDADKYVRVHGKKERMSEKERRRREKEEQAQPYYDDDEDDDDEDDTAPITLDVIAAEQQRDDELQHLMRSKPKMFSTATNGAIQLVTARSSVDERYRIVIPRSLQARVLTTYHDCLVNPTEDNNFDKVLYVHFTWNGIHEDVEEYVENEGLTEEMRSRGKPQSSRQGSVAFNSIDDSTLESASVLDVSGIDRKSQRRISGPDRETPEPISLEEIAKEQRKDAQLRELKRDEPFVFSTVKYGPTLLTTAQNMQDHRYRIVIPRTLQARMLMTYHDCLMHPTPERNFDTLLYEHFTWNGIHQDIDDYVEGGGRLPAHLLDDGDKQRGADDGDDFFLDEPSLHRRSKRSRSSLAAGTKKVFRSKSDEREYDKWVKQAKRFDRQLRRIRITFIVSGVCVIVSSILFYTQGVMSFWNSLDSVQGSVSVAGDVAEKTLDVTGTFLQMQSKARSSAIAFGTSNTTDWCPEGSWWEDSLLEETRNRTFSIADTLITAVNFIEREVASLEDDLRDLVDLTNDANDTIDTYKPLLHLGAVFMGILDAIVLSLMIAAVLTWLKLDNCFLRLVRNCVVLPLFITFMVLFWLISTAFLLLSMASADYCASPDEITSAVLMRKKDDFHSFLFFLLMFYIKGCDDEQKPPELERMATMLTASGTALHDFLAKLGGINPNDLTALCGAGVNPGMLIALGSTLDLVIHQALDLLFGLRDILSCGSFNPIYTGLSYDAICLYAVDGLAWIFATGLCIGVCCMTMLTLRVAFYPVKEKKMK